MGDTHSNQLQVCETPRGALESYLTLASSIYGSLLILLEMTGRRCRKRPDGLCPTLPPVLEAPADGWIDWLTPNSGLGRFVTTSQVYHVPTSGSFSIPVLLFWLADRSKHASSMSSLPNFCLLSSTTPSLTTWQISKPVFVIYLVLYPVSHSVCELPKSRRS